jgi:hypothetical protein
MIGGEGMLAGAEPATCENKEAQLRSTDSRFK